MDNRVLWMSTKKNVEEVITKYDRYCLSICNNSNNKADENYLFNLIEECEVEEDLYPNISKEEIEKRIRYINYVRNAYNKLSVMERKIIYWAYLDKENKRDDRYISNKLNFSLGYYYTKKKEAIIRFAYSLGVEESD